MSYTKTVWTAEVGTLLNRFSKSSETDDNVILTRNPESVTTVGTTFSVANMNNIEDGIEDVDTRLIAIEPYLDQAVLTTSSPVFAGLSVGAGANTSISVGYGYLGYNGSNSGYFNIVNRTTEYNAITSNTFLGLSISQGAETIIGGSPIYLNPYGEDGADLGYQKGVIIGASTDNGDLFQVAPDTDVTATIGRGKLGYISVNDYFYMTHYDSNNITDYNILMLSNQTLLNAKSTGSVKIRNNDTDVAKFESSTITMYQPVTHSYDGQVSEFFTDTQGQGLEIFVRGTDNNIGLTDTTESKPFLRYVGNAVASSTVLRLQESGGNVLIGTSTDSGYKLDVAGTLRATKGRVASYTKASTVTGATLYSEIVAIFDSGNSYIASGAIYSSNTGELTVSYVEVASTSVTFRGLIGGVISNIKINSSNSTSYNVSISI